MTSAQKLQAIQYILQGGYAEDDGLFGGKRIPCGRMRKPDRGTGKLQPMCARTDRHKYMPSTCKGIRGSNRCERKVPRKTSPYNRFVKSVIKSGKAKSFKQAAKLWHKSPLSKK